MGRFSKLETDKNSTPQEAVGQRRAGESRPTASEPVYDAPYYVNAGIQHYFSGDLKRALQLFSRATQVDRANLEGWAWQLLTLISLKQYKEAMVWVLRALELFPQDARIISLQGLAFAHQGMAQRGLQCSDYAIQQNASDPYVWLWRGQILLLAENPNAEFCMGKAMESRRSDEWIIPALIGLAYLDQRNFARAASFLETAVQEVPQNDYLWTQLGIARERLGLMQKALECYETAVRLTPKNRVAQERLVRITQSPWLARILRRIFPF